VSDVSFLIACPRSGTTWLRAALRAHAQVIATEHRFFGDFYDVVHDAESTQPRVRMTMQRYVQGLMQHAGSTQDARAMLRPMVRGALEVARQISHKQFVVETITPYLETAHDVGIGIQETFPGAPIVHLVRDGRDVLVSGVMHWLSKSGSGANEQQRQRRREWLLEGGKPLDRLFVDEEIVEWTSAWHEAHETVQAIRGHAMLEIRYEQMLADHSGVLREVLAHIGARVDGEIIAHLVEASSFEAMTERRSSEQPDSHIRRGIAGEWKRWFTRHDAQLFDALAGDLLKEYGYEPDNRWIETLPGRLPAIATTEKRELLRR
jgi:Sulfotransferase domain